MRDSEEEMCIQVQQNTAKFILRIYNYNNKYNENVPRLRPNQSKHSKHAYSFRPDFKASISSKVKRI